MSNTSNFPMTYGKVPARQRCAVVKSTIFKSPKLGDVFIACEQPESVEAVFNKLSRSTAYKDSIAQDVVIFNRSDALVGNESRAEEVESPWEKMDSAPKDGTEVVLIVKKRAGIPHCQVVGHYMPGGHCIQDHPPISEGWYFWNGCGFDYAAKPLLWMPLPKVNENQLRFIAEQEMATHKAGAA